MRIGALSGRTRYIDLNIIFAACNLIFMAVTLLAFGHLQNHPYLDQRSLLLTVLLSIETHIALFFERRHRDPFVILLVSTTVFFYSFRILTLLLFPYSLVFNRYSYGAGNSNYALIFILVSNAALYAGLFTVSFRAIQTIEVGNWRASSTGKAIFLLLAGVVFAYSSDRYWTSQTVPRVLNFLVLLAAQNIIVMLAFAYYLLFRRSIGRLGSIALIALIISEALLHFLNGSRSALITIFQNYLLVALAISGTVRVSRRLAVSSLFLLPFIVVILIGSFTISSYIRSSVRTKDTAFDVSRAIGLALQSKDYFATEATLDVVLPPVFARAGYFDFSAELIANSNRYSSLINVPTYAKSIVDNLLTPGFDIYDQPKLSNSLHFIYEELGTPSKKIVAEEYQSDQFGLYGEFYNVFNWASIPILFFLAIVLKQLYRGLKGTNPFDLTVKRILVLFIFSELLSSYGIDWIVIEVVPMVAAIVLYRGFFSTERINRGRASPASDPGFRAPEQIRSN